MAPTLTRADAALASVSFRAALRYGLWLGFISFGGPAGHMADLHLELVERCSRNERRE